MSSHVLTVFNAIDVPPAVQLEVMALLAPYSPDTYQRDCDLEGFAL